MHTYEYCCFQWKGTIVFMDKKIRRHHKLSLSYDIKLRDSYIFNSQRKYVIPVLRSVFFH